MTSIQMLKIYLWRTLTVRESAEACAAALIEAAGAISSGTSEVEDAGEHIFCNLVVL